MEKLDAKYNEKKNNANERIENHILQDKSSQVQSGHYDNATFEAKHLHEAKINNPTFEALPTFSGL